MKRIAAIACFCLAFPCAAAPTADPKQAMQERVARYYAANLEPALLTIRIGRMLVTECADRYTAECSETEKVAAASKDSTIEILDLLTLFPTRFRFDAEPHQTYAQMSETFAKLNEELLNLSSSYDVRLFARYGATLRACPPEDVAKWRKSLASIQATDYKDFMHLSEEALKSAIEHMVREELHLAEVIKHDWAPGECAVAQETGLILLQHMYTKLEPWMPGAEHPEVPDVRRDAAATFVRSAAIELEMMVNPGVREQIIAIEKRRDEARGAKP